MTTRWQHAWDDRDPVALAAAGQWPGTTLIDALDAACLSWPAKVALIDAGQSFTFEQLRGESGRMATLLAKRGVGAGDVVSMQLPNWHEAVLLVIATAMLGAVINPIVPIYRDAEVDFILSDAKAKLLITPKAYRGFDYAAMAARLREVAAGSCEVMAIRGACALSMPEKPYVSEISADPHAPRLLMYTSGTTGRAKGVVHSSNTLAAELQAVADYWSVTADDVILMPSPLTHITGYLYGIELPVRTGARVVLMDRWDADCAIDLIEEHGVTLIVGATPFLAELSNRALHRGVRLPSLRLFACGGAPVAPEVMHRANRAFANCATTRIYGSTEAPTVTLGVPERHLSDRAAQTEGRIVNHEVRVVDAAGKEVAVGEEGEVLTRGPEVMLGYLNPADEADAFTPDGFFRTGDLARIHADGMLEITGRKKDLIIRGGENIAPKEIEDILLTCDDVTEAAVVAGPSERMGECVCAFVVPKAGAVPTQQMIVDHVARSGLARQKWPEMVIFRSELPKTAAGKVRKDVLRSAAFAQSAA